MSIHLIHARSSALFASVLLAAGSASADPIAIESYAGKRPDDAGRLLGPVLEELTANGFRVGYDGVGRLFEGTVSRSARTEAGMPGDFADDVDRGHTAWIDGRFEEAIAILGPLVETAHDNAAAVSQDRSLRARVQAALLDFALAHQRNGEPDAAANAIGELLRSFPELQITKASHGPDAFALWDGTRKKLSARGTLVVEVADGGTSVFLDEQYATAGTLRRDDLYPGVYRVYAAKGDLEGRTYIVEVKSGEESKIRIDIALDARLHVDPSWTGLAFTTQDERDDLQGSYAARFAKLHGASAVAVIGIETVDGQRVLAGSLVSLDTGHEIRGARVAADRSSDARRNLARYLAGDESVKGQLMIVDPSASTVDRRRKTVSRWGVIKYLATGVGLAAAGTGAYLLTLDGDCKSGTGPCQQVYNTGVPGWSLVGGGASLVALGIYMFATDAKRVENVRVEPTAGGAMAFYRFTW